MLWQQESQIIPYKNPPPMTTVAVHPDQATCVAGAHALAAARRQRVLERSPVPPGGPADYERRYVLTVASGIMPHKNKQGHSVILDNWHSANYQKDPAADVLKAWSFIYSASCWPVGVTPQ